MFCRRMLGIVVLMTLVGAGLKPAHNLASESIDDSTVEAGLKPAPTQFLEGSSAKMGRGLSNVVFSFGEYARHMECATQQQGIAQGMFTGLIRGSFMSVVRAAVGVIEIGTFLIPIPPDFKPILQPKFVFDDFGRGSDRCGE